MAGESSEKSKIGGHNRPQRFGESAIKPLLHWQTKSHPGWRMTFKIVRAIGNIIKWKK
jgi:hypothetical protein